MKPAMRCPATILLALVATSAAAQPWTPSPCRVAFEGRWAQYARTLREAEPGSPLYVPKPFPRTDAEVLEDFRYACTKLWSGTRPEKIPADERALFAGVRANSLTFRVERVENWTPTRCLPERRRDFHFLLHIHDTRTGVEVGRFVLNQDGLPSGWTTRPTSTATSAKALRREAPRLEAALEKARSRFGVEGSRAQYAATYGDLGCTLVAPCVAMQARGTSYLLQGDDLFELGPMSRGLSLDAMNDPARRSAFERTLDPSRERLVSVGADRWVVARRLAPVE